MKKVKLTFELEVDVDVRADVSQGFGLCIDDGYISGIVDGCDRSVARLHEVELEAVKVEEVDTRTFQLISASNSQTVYSQIVDRHTAFQLLASHFLANGTDIDALAYVDNMKPGELNLVKQGKAFLVIKE